MRLDVENISSMEEHFDDYMKSVVSLLTGVLFSELELRVVKNAFYSGAASCLILVISDKKASLPTTC